MIRVGPGPKRYNLKAENENPAPLKSTKIP
jgi:hypothetical protein